MKMMKMMTGCRMKVLRWISAQQKDQPKTDQVYAVRVSRRKKLIKLYEVSITTGPPGDFVGPDDVVSTENTRQQVASYLNEIQVKDEPFKTKMTPSLQFLKEQITKISSNVQIFNRVSLSYFKILH
jgi:hypothetical protein